MNGIPATGAVNKDSQSREELALSPECTAVLCTYPPTYFSYSFYSRVQYIHVHCSPVYLPTQILHTHSTVEINIYMYIVHCRN